MATNVSNVVTASSGAVPSGNSSTNIITALGQVFKLQTGDTMSGERIAQMLIANMGQLGELAKQGKLNHQQITQLKEFAEKHKAGAGAALNGAAGANTAAGAAGNAVSSSNNAQASSTATKGAAGQQAQPATQTQTQTQPQSQQSTPGAGAGGGGGGQAVAGASSSAGASASANANANAVAAATHTGIKSGSLAPMLGSTPASLETYPISQTLNATNPGPVSWASAQQGRPTLTGGMAAGRTFGTPAQISRGTEDVAMLNLDDNRARRKNTPGDQSMRRSIQDLVSSVDPNVKIEPEVEDLLLSIADEFIDSVANFGCRLAKHRGGDTLEVRDLQLHLERNHNIRIPGFASDETRLSLSQPTIAPAIPPVTAKKAQQVSHMTLRSHRLAQVQQAKREGKLI